MKKKRNKYNKIALFFLLPFLAGGFLFICIPLAVTIKGSFWKRNGEFIGLYEYQKLFQSGSFILSVKNMLLFFLAALPFLFLLSLAVALSMQFLKKRNSRWISALFLFHLLPMLLPSAVITVIFKIFLETYGVWNKVLTESGKESISFLYSKYDFWILIGIYLWKNYGYCMIVLYGGINGVAEETIESAKLDGAGAVRILFQIIFPQIKSFLLFVGSLGVTAVFKIFRESYLLFGKYPHESVYMLQNFMNNRLYAMDYGALSAASFFLILFFSVWIYIIFLRGRKENEE